MVEGGGFEPPKAEPADLQSDPFGRSGTPPISGKLTIIFYKETPVNNLFTYLCQQKIQLIIFNIYTANKHKLNKYSWINNTKQ